MTDGITPRTAIQGFLDAASISKSTVALRPQRRRSIASVETAGPVEVGKRKSQSFSEFTPRTLIQGVLTSTEVAPDTARKRPRMTPQSKRKALTPGTATQSRIRRSNRLDVLATPGGSNPSPRTLIRGLVNAVPVETPWKGAPVVRRTSPRKKPEFPVVSENLQSQAQGLSLSPYIKDPGSIQRSSRKMLMGLRRAAGINREKFAAAIAKNLSQEKRSEDASDTELMPTASKDDSRVLRSMTLDSIHEADQDANDDKQKSDENITDKDAEVLGETLDMAEVAPTVSRDDSQVTRSMTLDNRHEEDQNANDDEQKSDENITDKDAEVLGETLDMAEVAPTVSRDDSQVTRSMTLDNRHEEDQNFTEEDVEDAEDVGETLEMAEAVHVAFQEDAQVGGSIQKDITDDENNNDEDNVEDEEDREEMIEEQISDDNGGTEDDGEAEEEPKDPVFEPFLVSNQSVDMEQESDKPLLAASNRLATPTSHIRRSFFHKEVLDTADQSTLEAGVIEADLSAGGDAHAELSTGDDGDDDDGDDDDALMPTQPAGASGRSRGIDTMLTTLQETNASNMVQTTLDGYSPLATPRIVPRRVRETPALKKTPLTYRAQTKFHGTSGGVDPKTVPAKKKTTARKQPQPGPVLNTLPVSLTKSIFTHFSRARISKEALGAVMQGSDLFFKRVSDDLMTYAVHAHRKTIEPADVELLMRRQGLITDKESMHSLIEKYLPMEYRQELIPIAKSGNLVTPKL